jgi:hypothetical protein
LRCCRSHTFQSDNFHRPEVCEHRSDPSGSRVCRNSKRKPRASGAEGDNYED